MLFLGVELFIFLWIVDIFKRKFLSNRQFILILLKKVKVVEIEEELYMEVSFICDG